MHSKNFMIPKVYGIDDKNFVIYPLCLTLDYCPKSYYDFASYEIVLLLMQRLQNNACTTM